MIRDGFAVLELTPEQKRNNALDGYRAPEIEQKQNLSWESVMREVIKDMSAAAVIIGFAWMITMWGAVLGVA